MELRSPGGTTQPVPLGSTRWKEPWFDGSAGEVTVVTTTGTISAH